ncbi:FAD-binding oxidoreductase [Actinoallomurus sp. NBC_01490]|jgi:glycine/D-amino acid oxidase-like deaminating enzyme|uniref:NAD(P)/FAD-dependent oxidoreductase n=1 Tax=Actinoallomurus sp. NBC_01490 TaxID=2903557 RepID=UPI002E33EC6C|nr:FAD-dependent oxidoreductase [Actinoallomurus sp. NBC_01490]
MTTVVVGGGILGTTLAARLSAGGRRVVLVEAHRFGSGTSAASFAWINAGNKHPESYYRLNLAGVREYLAERPPGYRNSGRLEWATAPAHAADLERRMATLTARGYRAEWVDPRRIAPELPTAPDRAALFPDEGVLHPAETVAYRCAEARRHGARLVEGRTVTSLRSDEAGAVVTLDDGETLAADRVVVAAGTATPRLLGAATPLCDHESVGAPGVGLLLRAAAPGLRLRRVVFTSSVHVRPDGPDGLIAQALDLDAQVDPQKEYHPGHPTAEEIIARVRALLGTDAVTARSLVVGRRPLPADGLPIAGWTDPHRRIYALVTHSGVTLAPVLARLVAAELAGEPQEPLAAYRPQRFATSTAPPVAAPRRPGEQ